jgi:hypothetical protein
MQRWLERPAEHTDQLRDTPPERSNPRAWPRER